MLLNPHSFDKLGDHPLDPLSECVLMHEATTGPSNNVPDWEMEITTDFKFGSYEMAKSEFTSENAPGWLKTTHTCRFEYLIYLKLI